MADVTLSGTAEWIAGSDDDTGTVVYKSTSAANRLDVSLSNGTRSEIRSNSTGVPKGIWIGPDGVSHPIANHNLMNDPGIFPAFTLGKLLSSTSTLLSYVGLETKNGSPAIHITASQLPTSSLTDAASAAQHLTQVEIYLDPSTLLPVSYAFNSHPDNNELLDIPTEIRYSNYQSVSGVQTPLHVQKYINGTLMLDLQFQNTSLNSGISAAQISAQ